MNIKELKEILDQYPDNMRVLITGYEQGLEDIKRNNISVDIVELYHHHCREENIGVYGPHEIVGTECFQVRLTDANLDNLEKVLIIWRDKN